MAKYGYLVLCKDCGYQQVEPTKDLADDTLAEHRTTHYGHNVVIERKAYNNKTSWDLDGYLRKIEIDPFKAHNLFAKRHIHQNFDDHNIEGKLDQIIKKLKGE